MNNLNDIKNKIEKENVKFFCVGISSDVLTNGIDLFNLNNFIDFIKSVKINVVFGCELFEAAEDYLITNEIIEFELGKYKAEEIHNIIINDIEIYNKKIEEIDFNIPFMFVIVCLYEGKYFFVKIKVDRGIDESFLKDPKEKLFEIILTKEENIQNQKQKVEKIINQLKKELKEIIISDENFLKCTNRRLRMNYIKDLLRNKLDEHFEPIKKIWVADTIKGIYQEPIDFVEILWREISK